MSKQFKRILVKQGNTWTFAYCVCKNESSNSKSKGEKNKKITVKQCKKENKITVKEYLIAWFEHHKNFIEPATANGYHVNIFNHIIPEIGDNQLSDLDVNDIENMCLNLKKNKNLSAKTIKYVYNVLKVALNKAVENKLIESNAALQAKTPKVSKYNAVVLSPNQLKIMFNYVRNTRYETEIKLAAVLGLRRGEVLGIRNQDVNFEKHTLSIQQQVSITKVINDSADDNKLFGIKNLKSSSSHRVIPISKDVENLIKRRQIYNNLQKSKLKDDYIDNDLLCCKDNGDIISPQALFRAFKEALKKCELPNIRFHDLRHSYATMLIDLNVPIKVISQNLGHSSIAVTDTVYADSILAKKNASIAISSLLNCY